LRTLWRTVLTRMHDPLIAVLGLAYKQDTHSTKNSPAIALLASLASVRTCVFDPAVPASVAPGALCRGAQSELAACEGADALAVMTPWEQFRKIDPRQLAGRMRGKVVLDPYAVMNAADCRAAGLAYYTLGVD
jgi:UDPglucose 6-dehydrogenase